MAGWVDEGAEARPQDELGRSTTRISIFNLAVFTNLHPLWFSYYLVYIFYCIIKEIELHINFIYYETINQITKNFKISTKQYIKFFKKLVRPCTSTAGWHLRTTRYNTTFFSVLVRSKEWVFSANIIYGNDLSKAKLINEPFVLT